MNSLFTTLILPNESLYRNQLLKIKQIISPASKDTKEE